MFKYIPVTRAYWAQYYTQLTVLLVMIYQLQWARYLDWYLLCLVFSVLVNGALHFVFDERRPRQFLISASSIIIPTSVFLFLTGESLSTYLIGIFFGLAAKFLIRVRGQHIFNPSAIAILFMAAFGEGVWINPLVKEANPWWLVYVFGAGLMTSYNAKRLPSSFSYFGGLVATLLIFWAFGFQAAPLHLASLLCIQISLMTFNVLTDPKTSPSDTREQIVFGLSIAILDAVFRALWLYQSSMLALCVVYAAYALWRNRDVVVIKRLVPAGVVLAIVLAGIQWGYFPSPTAKSVFGDITYEQTPKLPEDQLPLHFEEISEKLGLTQTAGFDEDELRGMSRIRAMVFNGFGAPSLAVADFDGDGYQDLLVGGLPGHFALYKNQRGHGFKDVTETMGLGDINLKSAAFFDYNNDGKPDIFGITPKSVLQIFENRGGKFVNVSEALHLEKINPGRVRSISFLDYDRDGYLDVFISNFAKAVDGVPGTGGNLMLKNREAKSFTNETRALGLNSPKLTHAVGVADLNGDGYPDLYVANDFDRDQIFINQQGKHFANETRRMLGNIHHRNSMTVEVADIEATGQQHLYVTNFSTSLWKHGTNYLWSPADKTGELKNIANAKDTGRCGFAWGAKFFDPDHDGNLDLFVASGMRTGKDPAWYLVTIFRLVPRFLDKDFVLAGFPPDPDFGAHTRNCFFWKKDGKYVDIADQIGLGHDVDSHTVALIDPDNSGRQIILVGTFNGLIRAYRPVIKENNNWLGLELVGSSGSRDPLGAKVSLLNFKAPVKVHYPSNGVAVQHDPREVFGLGKFAKPVDVAVEWPNGTRQIVRDLKPNTYHRIVENKELASARED